MLTACLLISFLAMLLIHSLLMSQRLLSCALRMACTIRGLAVAVPNVQPVKDRIWQSLHDDCYAGHVKELYLFAVQHHVHVDLA